MPSPLRQAAGGLWKKEADQVYRLETQGWGSRGNTFPSPAPPMSCNLAAPSGLLPQPGFLYLFDQTHLLSTYTSMAVTWGLTWQRSIRHPRCFRHLLYTQTYTTTLAPFSLSRRQCRTHSGEPGSHHGSRTLRSSRLHSVLFHPDTDAYRRSGTVLTQPQLTRQTTSILGEKTGRNRCPWPCRHWSCVLQDWSP